MEILEINNLKKSFGTKEVIKDVSFSISENKIFGFVGQNGAGKTTTMKMILGLLSKDEGEIKINGKCVKFGDTETNKYIGYLPDVPEFYTYMTTREYLRFCGEIAGLGGEVLENRVEELLELVGLKEERRRIKGFSRGMKQRLGIVQALIHKPKLLICDEPTSALDPIGRKEILDVLVAVKKETTVIFSTHILSDVEKICDEVVFLHEGKIVLSGTIEEIRHKGNDKNYNIELDDSDDLPKLLSFGETEAAKEMCIIKRLDDITVNVVCSDKTAINKVIEYMIKENISFNSINRIDTSLENLFLEVAGR